MRSFLLLALFSLSCRTRLLDDADAAPAIDAARSTDSAIADLSQPSGGGPCPIACDASSELCVFLDRGDCSKWVCAPIPPGCADDRSCACVGGDAFCANFLQGGETLTCKPPFSGTGGDIVCMSSILCV